MRLRGDMSKLVEELRSAIPAVFESDEYRARAQELEQEFQEQQENAIEEIRELAKEKHIALIRTPSGFAFAHLIAQDTPHETAARYRLDRFRTGHGLMDEEGTGAQHNLH